MRNGFKVYDSDTHVTASAEELEPYLPSSVKGLVPELEKYKTPIRRTSAGAVLEHDGLRSSWVPSYPLPTANGSLRAG